MITPTAVARVYAGQTIACLGSGPSLCRADVEPLVAADVRIIAINDAHTIAPEADVLYAADEHWWRWHKGAPSFRGQRIGIEPQRIAWPGLQVVRNTGRDGLELAPDGLRTGGTSGTSGYQAINLAVHLGAARVLLLGYDLQGRHFFGEHPNKTVPNFLAARLAFEMLVAPLAALGVSVINCSRETTLTAFPRASLADVLGVTVSR